MAAWAGSNKFTPLGKQEYMEVFEGVNSRDFSVNLVDRINDGWALSEQRNVASERQSNRVNDS